MRKKNVFCDVSIRRHQLGLLSDSGDPIPTFVSYRGDLVYELRNRRTTSKLLMFVRLLNLKFRNGFAADMIGTSHSPHELSLYDALDGHRRHAAADLVGACVGRAYSTKIVVRNCDEEPLSPKKVTW
jgi:hypothetical protein